MGLVASGSSVPNASTLAGSSTVGGSTGPAAAVILAVMDCRNATGIMPAPTPLSQLLPNLTVSAVVQDPLLIFSFYSDISTLNYTLTGTGAPLPVTGITTFPTIGVVPFSTSTPGCLTQVVYRWPAGGNYMFADVVPVLGPYCVVSVSGLGLFNVTVNQANGKFSPLVLSGVRDDYANVRGKLGTFIGGESGVAVAATTTVTRTVPVLVSGEVYISGSASISGASALTIQVSSIGPDLSASFVGALITRVPSDVSGNYLQTRMVLPPCYLLVSITNTTAGAMTAAYWITKGSF